jgi:iron(III) transport system permease protein
LSIASGRVDGLPALAAVGRIAGLVTLPNVALVACVLAAVWFVFVPLSALVYNAFTEDTGFGPGAFSLDNFVEAYSSWHILRLFRNSLIFAAATALTTFVMGALVAWVVERTDAPGGALFHTLSLLSFAIPGLLMAMAWIFVFSPNIGWGNAVLKSAFGLAEAPVNIYSMAGMTGRWRATIFRSPIWRWDRPCACSTCAWRRPR